MKNIDLDINNYSIRDLQRFFKLSDDCDKDDFNQTVDEFKNSVLLNNEIDNELKNNLLTFFKNATEFMNNAKYNHENTVQPLPVNFLSGGEAKDVIEKKKTPFVFTNPSDFFPGNLNPIEKRLVTRLVSVDTLFRETEKKITSSTNFLFKLPEKLSNVVSMQITAFELPRMWYAFSSKHKNNIMIIKLYNMVDYPDTEHKVNIPDGNYTSDVFENILNNYFNSVGNGLNYLSVTVSTMTSKTIIRARVASDPGTNPKPFDHLNISYSPNFYFELFFKVENLPLYKTLGWMMGFRETYYKVTKDNIKLDLITSTVSFIEYKGYLESESSYGSNIDNYVFVDIDDYNRNFTTDTITSINSPDSFIGQNILARISLTSGAYTIVGNTSADRIFKKREYFGPVNIEKLHVRLLNKFGDIIDLIENDYSFVLEFKQLYS